MSDQDQARAALLEKKAELEARLVRTHKHIHGREEPVSARFSEQVKETENDGLDAGTWSTCSRC